MRPIDIYLNQYKFSPLSLERYYYIFKNFDEYRTDVSCKAIGLLWNAPLEYRLFNGVSEFIKHLQDLGMAEISGVGKLEDFIASTIQFKLDIIHTFNKFLSGPISGSDLSLFDSVASENNIEFYFQGKLDDVTEAVYPEHQNSINRDPEYDGDDDDDDDDEDDAEDSIDGSVHRETGNLNLNEQDDGDNLIIFSFNRPKDFEEVKKSSIIKFNKLVRIHDMKSIMRLFLHNKVGSSITESSTFLSPSEYTLHSLLKRTKIRDFSKLIIYKTFDKSIFNSVDSLNKKLDVLLSTALENERDSNVGGFGGSSDSISKIDDEMMKGKKSEYVGEDYDEELDDGEANDRTSSIPDYEVIILSAEEIQAFYNNKFKLIYLYFTVNDYTSVINEFTNLLESEKKSGIKGIKPFRDILEKDEEDDSNVNDSAYDNSLIYKDYFIFIILLSLMLCKSSIEFDNMVNSVDLFQVFLNLIDTSDPMIDCLTRQRFTQLVNDYQKCEFQSLFSGLDSLLCDVFQLDPRLHNAIEDLKINLRRKCLVFYLSLMKKVSFDKLLQEFYSNEREKCKDMVVDEVNYLINLMNFQRIKIDYMNEIVEYCGSDESTVLTEKFQKIMDLNKVYQVDYQSVKLNVLLSNTN